MAGNDTIALNFKVGGDADLKRALSDINNALKVSSSEMSLATAQYSSNEKSAQSLTAQNKILQQTITEQSQKVDLLKTAVQNAAAAHESAGQQIEALKAKLADARARMDEMKSSSGTTSSELKTQALTVQSLEKELNNAEKAYTNTGKSETSYETQLNSAKASIINMNKELDTNQQALKKAETGNKSVADAVNGLASAAGINIPPAMQGMVSKLDNVSESGAALVGVLGGAVVALTKMTVATAKTADDIMTLSSTSGMTTDQIQELSYASELLDVSVDTVDGSITKMIRSMESSKTKTSDQAKAFKELHVSATDANGQLRDANDVFLRTVDALGKVSNETERDSLSMTIFGKSARDLNPLIEAGSGKLRELSQEAHNVGYVMSGDTLESFGELDDAMQRLDKQGDTLKNSFAVALLPILTALAEAFGKIPVPVLQTTIVLAGIITTIVLAAKAIKEMTGTGSAIAHFFTDFDVHSLKTAAIVMGVVAALIALAAIIAVIIGKSNDLNSTMSSISSNVGKISSAATTSTQNSMSRVPSYAKNARGTSNWRGGRTLVGEEGPEVVDLPAGSRVYPHGVNPPAQYVFNGSIVIDAKNVKEFNDILKFAAQQGQLMVKMGGQ